MANPGRVSTIGLCKGRVWAPIFPLLSSGDVSVERRREPSWCRRWLREAAGDTITQDQAGLGLCCRDSNLEDETGLWACKHLLPPRHESVQSMAPSADHSHAPTCAPKICKTSQPRCDLSPARTDSSLCWEDGEEIPLSCSSHLRRTQKLFSEHRPHKHLQKHPFPDVTSFSQFLPFNQFIWWCLYF